MSMKTGTAPSLEMDAPVAKKVKETVTTRSPGLIPKAIKESSRASVPEATPMAWGTPQ